MAPTMEIVKRPVIQLIKESVPEFAKRLPVTIDATKWVMQLATVVQKNPDLLGCDQNSLFLAAYEAAELGVRLSPALQLGYILAYGGKAQFQISWRGLVQRAYETGCVRSFFGEIVYEHDKFERQYAPKRNLFHAPGDGDRGEMIGAYALVEFKDGSIDWEYVDRKLIERHRKHSRQPDSLMWSKFQEEAWKKTAIRILAKRLPLTNPGMEALAEVIARDAQAEMEPEPAGRLELDAESPILAAPNPMLLEKPRQIESIRDSEGIAEVFFDVGEETTTITGRTMPIKDVLPKLGGKWDKDARVWRIPAARTHELVAACEEKQICAEEVSPSKQGELL
jgi:recombination protein RecT